MTAADHQQQAGAFAVVHSTYPNTGRDIAHFPVGQTLAEALGPDCSESVRVSLAGIHVPRERWHLIRPREGVTVNARVIPQHGGAGKILRSVALIALAVYAPTLAGQMTGEFGIFAGASTALVTAGITLIGSLTGSALDASGVPA